MKRVLPIILLATISASVVAQSANRAQIALGLRAQESANAANAQQTARYAENRQRCQAALRIAKLCGKFAGKFSCDEKGFKELTEPTSKPIIRDGASVYRMERCAADAAGKNP